ncbi:phage tail protein [Undibacterium curvum]|jgi:microcystin-dependent protein|uniref:Phage tail protein n=1 Tax=Undibacterium curvum TaxID=2762294 RepID=A0ABR7A690_9BURK|nr:tail fiber protein [Undibacterium curvum]MBC3932411.1 phage tail protein [Undibacterium curvum]
MADPFLGEIRAFGFSFAPQDWAYCFGNTISIMQNQALYTVLRTQYGGDGKTTFNLPNLSGLAIRGLQGDFVNKPSGSETVALSSMQVPPHTHTLTGVNGRASETKAAGNLPGQFTKPTNVYTVASADKLTLPTTLVSPFEGGTDPHENRQPLLVLNFCICLYGVYPLRP